MRALRFRTTAAALSLALLLVASCSKTHVQTRFATQDDAAKALMQAFKTSDMKQIDAIFGRDAMQSLASGDPVSDRHHRQVIALAMEQSWRWTSIGNDRAELIIGDERWPFPAQLMKADGKWQFDTEGAKEEILARRIGANELDVIDLCRSLVGMQKNYAAQPHDGKRAGLFAKQLRSSSGQHDGLYWPTKRGERRSPLGDLAAQAEAQGYSKDRSPEAPFWGYYFRVLTAQGDAAPGGKKSYVVNGEMSGGFAFLAFPAKYASSGVMTFIVGQDGVVYQKDLGKETPTLAGNMTEYSPDESWTRADED